MCVSLMEFVEVTVVSRLKVYLAVAFSDCRALISDSKF